MKKDDTRTKIEKYIDSRLWNAKKRGKGYKASTRKILEEIDKHYFRGKIDKDINFKRRTTKYIQRSRSRSSSRWDHYLQSAEKWAESLSTEKEIVLKLIRMTTIKSYGDVKRLRVALKVMRYIPDND
jgi:hypothetical protein